MYLDNLYLSICKGRQCLFQCREIEEEFTSLLPKWPKWLSRARYFEAGSQEPDPSLPCIGKTSNTQAITASIEL